MSLTRRETATGTTILVWHEGDGFVHIEPNTNQHEAMVWREVIAEAFDATTMDTFREVCGYLERVDDDAPWISIKAVHVTNVATDGEFAFPDDDVYAAYDLMESGYCLGLWHSHPNGDPNPSATDWAGHPRNPNVPMFIVALDQDLPHMASVVRYTEDDRP